MPAPRIAIVAGEASGDLLGGHLIRAVRAQCPDARFYGIAGRNMIHAGAHTLFPLEKLSVSGYAEVWRALPELLRIRWKLKQHILADKPDVFIGIDAPDFNLGLERALKQRGIPTLHFVSPSIWAWRAGRINKIVRAVSRMLVVFPFEESIYRQAGLPVNYVGHPLADTLPDEPDQLAARQRLNLPVGIPVVALLPGSRESEVRQHAALFVDTAARLRQRFPTMRFVAPFANRVTREIFIAALHEQADALPVHIMNGHADYAMTAADMVLVASGTATLEAALLKRPMVITYRVKPFTAWLMRKRAYLPWVGLPNILAQEFVVPELLQEQATAEHLARALGDLYEDMPRREHIVKVFAQLHQTLKQDTAKKIADAILPYLSCN